MRAGVRHEPRTDGGHMANLRVVIDQFSRRVIGWSAQSRMTTDLALQALFMAIWRRKPSDRVTLHSDLGSQFTSREWQTFLHQHDLEQCSHRTCFARSPHALRAWLPLDIPGDGARSSRERRRQPDIYEKGGQADPEDPFGAVDTGTRGHAERAAAAAPVSCPCHGCCGPKRCHQNRTVS